MMYLRRVVVLALGVLTMLALYVGVWRPYMRAELIIVAYQNFNSARTLQAAEKAYVLPLLYWAPWGGDELVGTATESVFGLVQSLDAQSAPAAAELARFAEELNRPLLLRGKGSGFMRGLSRLATLEHVAWFLTNDRVFAEASEGHFRRCLEASPRRPECLYGLFNLLRQEGRSREALAIGKEILGYWPSDTQAARIVRDLGGEKR